MAPEATKMSGKRSKHEIVKDILKVIVDNQNAIGPTKLLRLSNLSFQMYGEYVADLIDKGFVLEIQVSEKKKSFSVSEKGLKFLEKYDLFLEFLSDFGM